jgi:signal transduction histidine kinase
MRAVRLRVTALATAVVVATLAITGLAIVVVQRRLLLRDLDDSLDDQAQAIAAAVQRGDLPDVLVLSEGDDDDVARVVAADGTVLATNGGVDDGDARRVARVEVPASAGVVVVEVSGRTDDIDEATGAVIAALLLAIPTAAAVLALTTWMLVGRTLRPVEAAARRERQFVADASHELRTPLTRMRTELEVDLAHPDGADPLTTHRRVLDQTIMLQQLVDDMAHLARADAGAMPTREEPVDLDDVVLDEAHRTVTRPGVRLDHTAVSAVQVHGDPAQLRRAVQNLLDNAARHAVTSVAVGLAADAGQAVVTVVDDGPGIPADQRHRVFDRFARLDDARSVEDGGTGLGLAIAREIAERHGGSLVVDPGHEGGTRMVMVLPLTPRSGSTW